MKISIISASHRKNSQSRRISKIIEDYILKKNNSMDFFSLDMFESNIPLWTSEKKENSKFWNKEIKLISSELASSDGFIFVVPEYGGMATPNSKNFFLVFNNGELFHKPGLIVSISSGNGGSYPISENIIIRNVEQFLPGNHGELIPAWIDDRINYSCDLLIKYSQFLKPIQNYINRKDFSNGM